MADTLTTTGLHIDDLETRRAAVVAKVRAEISSILDVSPDQPTGQLIDILLERIQSNAELLQIIHSAMDPDQATGQSQDGVASITGTYRRAPTKGTVELKLTLDAATTVPAGSIAAVSGDPDNQWVTTADVTSVGAGDYTVDAEASETGPIQGLAGSISVIVTPVAGWNAVTNDLDASAGTDEETDVALRLRREIEVVLGGSTSVDAIRAQLLGLDGMIQVAVYENDHWYPDAVGIAPHAIEALVWDSVSEDVANTDIAQVIFDEKPAGIKADGSILVNHTDAQGNAHAIRFSRASSYRLVLNYTLVTDDSYPGDTALKAAIVAWTTSNLVVGLQSLKYSVFYSLPFILVDGITDVGVFTWHKFGDAPTTSDLSIGAREVPTVDTGDITIV